MDSSIYIQVYMHPGNEKGQVSNRRERGWGGKSEPQRENQGDTGRENEAKTWERERERQDRDSQ